MDQILCSTLKVSAQRAAQPVLSQFLSFFPYADATVMQVLREASPISLSRYPANEKFLVIMLHRSILIVKCQEISSEISSGLVYTSLNDQCAKLLSIPTSQSYISFIYYFHIRGPATKQ